MHPVHPELAPEPAPEPAAGLSAGEVARRLGVAVTTVRTWDRRYGLGPARREPGRHRRYGPGDLARLELMRRLIGDGVAPAEAARVARTTPAPHTLAAAPAPDHAPGEPPAREPGQGGAGAAGWQPGRVPGSGAEGEVLS